MLTVLYFFFKYDICHKYRVWEHVQKMAEEVT